MKMNHKIRKGYYAPEENKDRIIIFIDDFNIPMKEKFGA